VSLAKVVVSGEVVGEPEKRFTPNNHPVATFNLKVENAAVGSRPPEPFFVRVTCWRNLADAVANQIQKGQFVLVEGRLMLNSYQAQDGTQKKSFEIEAASLDKLAGPSETLVPVSASAGANTAPKATNQAPASSSSYASVPVASSVGASSHFSSEDLLSEDDIPF
jgi:single-strand DNA-binding protein